MKRIFALVLSLVFLLSCLVLPAGAMFDPSPVYQVQAASAYIVNTDTNIIVYDKDSTRQVSAGGLTKYMTLAVLLTNYADQLDRRLRHRQWQHYLRGGYVPDFALPDEL